MIFITGDTHGSFRRIENFCLQHKTTYKDILIILGDAGINYYGERDYLLKEYLKDLSITLFCLHGNHEQRPNDIKSYHSKKYKNGIVYYEKEYPNILFAKDGEIYNFNNKQVLVIGGAYSVDKHYRLRNGYHWWDNEQLTEKEKQSILKKITNIDYKIDIVLTHTCPYKYIPKEMFLSGIDQSTVDNSSEEYLDIIESKLDYQKWYCGHFHTNKIIDKIEFLFEDIKQF